MIARAETLLIANCNLPDVSCLLSLSFQVNNTEVPSYDQNTL